MALAMQARFETPGRTGMTVVPAPPAPLMAQATASWEGGSIGRMIVPHPGDAA